MYPLILMPDISQNLYKAIDRLGLQH